MLKSEPEARLEIVGEQFQIEVDIAESKEGAVVFFVPSLLTPMFINSKAVRLNHDTGLSELDPDFEYTIPEGLIPQNKLNDPAQLSTVLERVVSFENMLRAGVKVVVLYSDAKRQKIDKETEFVDASNIMVLTEKYANYLVLKNISTEEYTSNKASICAATYSYKDDDDDQHEIFGIDKTQIHRSNSTSPEEWGVRTGEVAQKKLENLNSLLSKLDLRVAYFNHTLLA